MYKKYNFPLNIFMIFEKINATVFSSKCVIPNHFYLFISNKNLFLLNQIFKNEFFFCNSYLVDASCVDTLKYNQLFSNFKIFFKKKRNIIFHLYYFSILKLRLTVLTPASPLKNEKIKSSDSIFKNLNWIERELSEMFGVVFFFKKDSRKLLLDYSKEEFPMLKNFSTEGVNDVFYNFFEEQVVEVNSNCIEL